MDNLKKRFRRPSKVRFFSVLGWYLTRVVVAVLWCGVVWSLLGNDALPNRNGADGKNEVDSGCLPELSLSNDSLSELLDSLMLPSNTEDSIGNFSYLYTCNKSHHQYCLVTVGFNKSCVTKLFFIVSLLDDLSHTHANNFSVKTFTLEYDIAQAIDTELDREAASLTVSSSPQSLFDIPNGHFFALIVLVVVSGVGGMLARVVRLPPLLGMMVAGFLLRNVPVIGIAGDISSVWSSTLRNIALVVILLRGGLALDAKQLWKLKFAVPILAFLPGVTEGAVDGLVSIFLLGLPWRWGLMLGVGLAAAQRNAPFSPTAFIIISLLLLNRFILAAISPAVVVPTTLSLGERVRGINKGITTLIVAAANIDVVIAISLFSVFLGLIFSDGSVVLDAFRAPIEISLGIVYGVLCGLLMWILPTKHHTNSSKARNRFFLLFGFGLFSLFGGRRAVVGGASLSGAGALGVLCVAFVAVQKWTDEEKKLVTRSFYLLWQFAQPVLFGLIGAALNVKDISGQLVGKAIALIGTGMVFRLSMAVLAVTGNKFTIKEKAFVAISWIPKATVQAAIGSIALDLVRQNGATNQESLGMTVLTVAVLAIVLCAPLGAILSSVLGPWLLEHPVSSPENDLEKNSSTKDNQEEEDQPNGSVGANPAVVARDNDGESVVQESMKESTV